MHGLGHLNCIRCIAVNADRIGDNVDILAVYRLRLALGDRAQNLARNLLTGHGFMVHSYDLPTVVIIIEVGIELTAERYATACEYLRHRAIRIGNNRHTIT